MALRWAQAAYADLRRIHEFLEPVNSVVAVRVVRAVTSRVRRIPAQPRLGEKLTGFENREVRRVLVQRYEVRYEIAGSDIYVLRVFHTPEDRP
ncbi:MAG: type II toxin-antitoxin system RelE/ParE family toxin [Proteobacteria bacterium]|nr:type II toxin-antitoxin system RelE/ParE family toxin [Pseudomonadota bacterium]